MAGNSECTGIRSLVQQYDILNRLISRVNIQNNPNPSPCYENIDDKRRTVRLSKCRTITTYQRIHLDYEKIISATLARETQCLKLRFLSLWLVPLL